jgi:hypothetical protein
MLEFQPLSRGNKYTHLLKLHSYGLVYVVQILAK